MVWVVSASIIVLAIDDFVLVRMQRQRALRELLLQRCPQRLGLFFTATTADRIIGVSLEGNVRVVPRHPYVERVVQTRAIRLPFVICTGAFSHRSM